MKRTLLFGMLLLAGLSATAQINGDNNPLADGSIAPDFTATDINGNVHSLYADYLNQGKSVIIDFSATWCGPCWGYHQTHAMADFYEAYGPAGSDEIMVIFVEADLGTSTSSIFGTNTPTDNPNLPTQGNWTIGSPYPIIEDTPALNLGAGNKYDVDFFPTLYRICADTKQTKWLYQVTDGTVQQLKNIVNNDCQVLVGLANHGRLDATTTSVRVCPGSTLADVQGKIKNFGNNNITSATLAVKKDGAVIGTAEYTGNITQFTASPTITVEDVDFAAEGNYTLEVISINGSAPAKPELLGVDLDVTVSEESPNNIVVHIFTDNYPSEISWKLRDSNGTVVANGGPYQPGNADQWGGGGPDANTTKSHPVTLPDGVDCYSLELLDSFGDGWKYGNTPHGASISGATGTVFIQSVADFGNSLTISSVLKSMGALGNESFEASSFSIYPNPSTGLFTFNTAETVSVVVTDITGKTVFTAGNIENGSSINLSSLQAGVYIARVTGDTSERIEKLIIK